MTSPAIPIPSTDATDFGNLPGDGPLRAGGQPGNDYVNARSDSNLPSKQSLAAERQTKALELVRDISGGTERIRGRSVIYLPMAPGEAGDDYRLRLNRSVFFNVFSHTIEGLVGQVFRRDPTLNDDVPVQIRGDEDTEAEGHWENIDNAGTHGDVFARQLLQDALTTGHCGIFVEYPNVNPTGTVRLTLADEQQLRPYWIPIAKDNIVSWRVTVEDGRTLLRQLVLCEETMVENGEFGERKQTRYRVLYRLPAQNGAKAVVGFRLLEITDKKTLIEVDSGLYTTQTEIPFAEIATSGKKAMLESDPPLLDLAYVNIAHYQQWSDYALSIHKTCVPILTMIGLNSNEDGEPKAVIVGPNSGLVLPLQGDAKYVSHSGQALGACKQSLDDLKSDMGTLGLAMLSPQKRTAETAAAKRLDKATEDSALAVTARGLQDGIERALGFHAKYLGLPEGGSIKVNKEFDAQSMAADMLTAWTQAVSLAKIPPRLMVDAMQVGELIDQDEDVDAIALEMEANVAAEAAQKANALQDQITNARGTPPKTGAAADSGAAAA